MTPAALALAAMTLALLGVLGGEFMPAAPEAAPPPAVAAARHQAEAEEPPVAAWANIALSRPLFAPDRHPVAAAGGAVASVPRLAGIIRTDTPLAIFAPAGADHAIVAAREGEVAGWTVQDIRDGEVVLVQGTRIATVRLSYADLPVVVQAQASTGMTLLHDKKTSPPFLQP